MARKFIDVDYEAILEMRVRIGDVLPATHLARFIVGIIERLDLSSIYAGYGEQGAPAYAPEMLFGILVYGYATGVFSARNLEDATHESVPFIYIAGGRHPDHDTLNTFRSRFLAEIGELYGVSDEVVRYRMNQLGIPRRDKSEAARGPRPDRRRLRLVSHYDQVLSLLD